jgi:hypothetical protein
MPSILGVILFLLALFSCEKSRQEGATTPPDDEPNAMQASYPDAVDTAKVGDYPALAHGGGGFVWDEVLEYRVWCHPENGAPDELDGEDYFYPFATYNDARDFSDATKGAEDPLALILQREWIDEPAPGDYRHMKEARITEWPVEFLQRPRRSPTTIPNFLSPDAPLNRLEILRGTASP